ncbi:MAG: phosphoribosyltransferase [Chitinivibrionales bacterium]
MERPFEDRTEAGQYLARLLKNYADRDDVCVLGLPRGGIPVAYQVSCSLHAPLDVFVVRKLGAPYQPELAMGAIAAGDTVVRNDDVVSSLGITDDEIERVAQKERQELLRREKTYRGDRGAVSVKGKIAILIDDGLATGASMRVAVQALKQHQPAKIIVAVPVASPDACGYFEDIVDDVVCGITPQPLFAIGYWYRNFDQTTDEQVQDLLRKAEQRCITRTR